MNNKVKCFLEEQQREFIAQREREKLKIMDSFNLVEKIYSPNNSPDDEYILCEYDEKELRNRYFKKVPLEINDQEFEILKNLYNKNQKSAKLQEKNLIAKALTVTAWIIFIGGFIAGISLGMAGMERGWYYIEFSFATAFVYWLASFISGTIFLGFAEIIKLLQDIKNK